MTLQSSIGFSETKSQRRRVVSAELCFERFGDRTYLTRQLTPYPFHITRPFNLSGDPDGFLTLYLQSCSGGLYGDDDLGLRIDMSAGAEAHVTTQASTVVNAARGGLSRLQTDLALAEGACLEYCPDPGILLPDARLRSSLRARLAPGGYLFAVDSFLAHDPRGEGAPFGDHLLKT